MPTPAGPAALVFSILVLAVVLFVLAAIRRAGLGIGAALGFLLAYVALPGFLARRGLLDRYNPLPAPALLLVLGLTLLTIAFALSPWGARVAGAVTLAVLVTLQAFRIVVEWVLHRLYLDGVVPVQMTYAGRNFDIVTGVTGLLLGAWLLSGRSLPRAALWAWNVLGLALLANIVIIAILSTPVSFRHFLSGPPNLLPSTFPFVWLPSLLVQVALASHLLIFRQLSKPAAV